MKVKGWRALFLPGWVVLALGAGSPAIAGKPDWKPVDPSELALKEAKVEDDSQDRRRPRGRGSAAIPAADPKQ